MVYQFAPVRFHSWSPYLIVDCDTHFEADRAKPKTRVVEPNYRVEDTKEASRVHVELPGVAPEDVSVEVKNHRVVVIGKRFDVQSAAEAEKDSENERKGGKENEAKGAEKEVKESKRRASVVYKLVAKLNRNVAEDAITAKNEGNGLLVLSVPVREIAPRKIEVA